MFGGGAVTAWTRDQLKGLALQKVLEAIRAGHSDHAKTMSRELLRLCLADKRLTYAALIAKPEVN